MNGDGEGLSEGAVEGGVKADRDSLEPVEIKFSDKSFSLILQIKEPTELLGHARDLAAEQGLSTTQPKSEFHLTPITFEIGKSIKNYIKSLPEAERPGAMYRIRALVESADWSYSLTDEIYHIQKDYPASKDKPDGEHRESVIAAVDVPGLDKFYEGLESATGLELPRPFMHATLLTSEGSTGIALSSQESFGSMRPRLL